MTHHTETIRQDRYAVIRHQTENWGHLYTIIDVYTSQRVYQTGYVLAGNALREARQLNGYSD